MSKVKTLLIISIWVTSWAAFGQEISKNDTAAKVDSALAEILTLSNPPDKLKDAVSTCNMKVKWRIREYHNVNGNIAWLNTIQNTTIQSILGEPAAQRAFKEAKDHVETFRSQISDLLHSGCVEGNLDYWQAYEKKFASVRDPSLQKSLYLTSDSSSK